MAKNSSKNLIKIEKPIARREESHDKENDYYASNISNMSFVKESIGHGPLNKSLTKSSSSFFEDKTGVTEKVKLATIKHKVDNSFT
jgi:hypothetical protein